MKPDWKDAPDWANWLAIDTCGYWTWFEKRPLVAGNLRFIIKVYFSKSRTQRVCRAEFKTLSRRPEGA